MGKAQLLNNKKEGKIHHSGIKTTPKQARPDAESDAQLILVKILLIHLDHSVTQCYYLG